MVSFVICQCTVTPTTVSCSYNPVLPMKMGAELSRKMTRLVTDPSHFLRTIFGLLILRGFIIANASANTCASENTHQQCIGAVIRGRSKNGVDLRIPCPTSSCIQGFLAASWHPDAPPTVCLQMSVCVCFNLLPDAGDLMDGPWLCLGSCLRQCCCTVSKFGLWQSPREA